MAIKAFSRLSGSLVLALLILSSCSSEIEYSIKSTVNPYDISPLTALLEIETEKPCNVSIKVLGEIPVEQTFNHNATELEIPVVGLYPNTLNNVQITLAYEGGQVIDTIQLKTENVPSHFPDITINKLNRDDMEPGMHACDLHFANHGKFNSGPIIFDDKGKVRWYLDLSFAGKMVSPFQRLRDGTVLMVSRHNIYEFDMLGKPLKETTINANYGMHHDLVELPDGNLLVCVGIRGQFITLDGEKVKSDSDFIVAIDRKSGKILRVWDLAKNLDVSRKDLNFFRPGDWLHMNGLAFNPSDNSIIVSGKNQGLIKISWNDNLEWIIAPHKGWGKSGRDGNGFETKPYLLTAVDAEGKPYRRSVQEGTESAEDFDFPWGLHAPLLLPNGNVLVFDNGTYRHFEDNVYYSRGVEYKINEKDKTVEQIWQYGKERGEEFFSTIVSDVDYLYNSNNILVTAGYLKKGTNLSAKIVEVNRETGEEVFEATLDLKSENGNKTGSWGQTDILYRSERMELKY